METPPCLWLEPGIQSQKTSGMGRALLQPLAGGQSSIPIAQAGQTPPTIRYPTPFYTPETNLFVSWSPWFGLLHHSL